MNNCNCQTPGTLVAPNYNRASSCVIPPTQLRTVTIPKDKGGDGPHDPYAPQLGAYQNTIVIYAKTGSVYLYDVNGVFTNLTGTDYASIILELQEQAEAQGQKLTQLSTELSQEILDRTNAIAELSQEIQSVSEAVTAETTNRETADNELQQQITSAQTQLNQFGTKLDGQAEDMATNIAALQENINALANKEAEDVADLQTNINKNTNDIAALQAGAGGESEAFGKELVLDIIAADPTANAVALTTTMGNLGTDMTTTTDINLPVVSATQAGVLTAEQYAALQGIFTYDESTKTLTINPVS